ncbi:MAG: hydrogenase expression/formation C-terminal domain-containing protein [Burkholderiaceae bacterium]
MKENYVPLVRLGPGSQIESESLDYLPMPKEMNTYRPPILPEPEEIAQVDGARRILQAVHTLLDEAASQGTTGSISLAGLAQADLALVNEVLGEGEASAVIKTHRKAVQIQVQESVFSGVWRLITTQGDTIIEDRIEVAPVPALFRQTAADDSQNEPGHWQGDVPLNIQNAPAIVDEIRHHVAQWQPGQTPHVVNLTLLPVTPEDIAFLDHQLGTGRVLMLSRGYGNCRISNTCLPNCWRVIYYNSFDKVILNTVEVIDMPEVAMAAPEDLRDSCERLHEVIAYVEAA